MNYGDPACCQTGKDHVRWRTADKFDGPDKDGWSLVENATADGEEVYCNIAFCPWCGARLPVEAKS